MNISEDLRKRIAHKAIDLGTDADTLIAAVLEEVFLPQVFAGGPPPNPDAYGGHVCEMGGGWLVPHWFRGLLPMYAIKEPYSYPNDWAHRMGICHSNSDVFRPRGWKS